MLMVSFLKKVDVFCNFCSTSFCDNFFLNKKPTYGFCLSLVIESFTKKEPIKVLVQAGLDVHRTRGDDVTLVQKRIRDSVRSASAQRAFLFLEDIQ